MKLEHILGSAVVVFAVLAIFIASRLGAWDQGVFVGVLVGAAFAALCSTPLLIAGAERGDAPPAPDAPVAPRPAIEWHGDGGAYMPARRRGERPAALIAAAPSGTLEAALRAIPGAEVRPPLRADGRNWVMVASFDAAFIAAARAAVQNVCGETCLIAGEAPPPREYDPKTL